MLKLPTEELYACQKRAEELYTGARTKPWTVETLKTQLRYNFSWEVINMITPFLERLINGVPAMKAKPNPSASHARREAFLAEVSKCVLQDRNTSYGDPEDNFQDIADHWTVYFRGRGISFSAVDVAAMMALVKVARLRTSPEKLDNWIDLAGYAACGAGCAQAAALTHSWSGETAQPAESLKENVSQDSAESGYFLVDPPSGSHFEQWRGWAESPVEARLAWGRSNHYPQAAEYPKGLRTVGPCTTPF